MCGSCYYYLTLTNTRSKKTKEEEGREGVSMLLKTKNPSFIINTFIYLFIASILQVTSSALLHSSYFTCIIRTVRCFTCIIRTVHLFCIHGNSHHNMLLIQTMLCELTCLRINFHYFLDNQIGSCDVDNDDYYEMHQLIMILVSFCSNYR